MSCVATGHVCTSLRVWKRLSDTQRAHLADSEPLVARLPRQPDRRKAGLRICSRRDIEALAETERVAAASPSRRAGLEQKVDGAAEVEKLKQFEQFRKQFE